VTTITLPRVELSGAFDLGEVPCRFDVDPELTLDFDDSWVCDSATATLVDARIGGFTAARYQVSDMIGEAALAAIEKEIGERYAEEWTAPEREDAA